MKGFLERKRREVRSGVFNNERQTYILLSSGAGYEAAKGLILVVPGLAMCIAGGTQIGVPMLIVGGLGYVAWSSFIWVVALRAAAQKGDKTYERFTRKHLSREYRDS